MANTASNVTAAKPAVTGAISIAPVGTTLPTTADGTLATGFESMGYVSEDGVSDDISKSMFKVKAWGGDVVLSGEDSFEESVKFKLIEVLNVNVLKFGFGAANVTGTSLSSGIKVEKKAGNDKPVSIVIDTILNGGILKRQVIPKGVLSGVGSIVQKMNEAMGIDCTVDCLVDGNGNTTYEYFKQPTTPGSGSAG